MTIRRVELERVSVKSSKPLDKIVAALEAEVGHPDIGEFFRDTNNARTFAELETVVYRSLGPTELMIFMKLDQGAVLRKETGLDTPRIVICWRPFATMSRGLRSRVKSLDEVIAAKPTAAYDAKWGGFVIDPAFFTRLV